MPVTLATEDLKFLKRVRDLGISGKTQPEIAEALDMSFGTLRFRLSRLGFELVPANNVRATLTGELLADLTERGELIEQSHKEAVPA